MIYNAYRIEKPKIPTKPPLGVVNRLVKMSGLRYERKVIQELKRFYGVLSVEQNPWFEYVGENKIPRICSPDALIHLPTNDIIVVEIKLTDTPTAFDKLKTIYIPVLRSALSKERSVRSLIPLVICKNLTQISPKPSITLSDALNEPIPLLHWIGKYNLI